MAEQAFIAYKEKQIYLKLSNPDYFLSENLTEQTRVELLNSAFDQAQTYKESIGELKNHLNDAGLKLYRDRFKRYKHAFKIKDNKATYKIDQHVATRLEIAKKQLGLDSVEELLEVLIENPADDLTDGLKGLITPSFDTLLKLIPLKYQKVINNHINQQIESAYLEGSLSVLPENHSKKRQQAADNAKKYTEQLVSSCD